MGRTESTKAANQGMDQSAQDQSAGQQALSSTNSALKKYSSNLDSFMKFGRDTYGQNGEFARDQNTIANTTASAGSKAIGGNLTLDAMRTGANTANFANTAAESQRQGERDMTSQLAGADATRLQNLTNINQQGVQMSALPAEVQASLYGTATGGAGSQLSSGANAAKMPGFWDTFAPALAGAAGTAAAGFCCVEGSLIKMADGSHKPVEQLKKGDWLWSTVVSPPNQVLSDPAEQMQEAWEIETDEGQVHRGSDTHTIALTTGGYANMPETLGRAIIGEYGGLFVKSAKSIGKQKVYPFKVGGSHCYIADGIMVLA